MTVQGGQVPGGFVRWSDAAKTAIQRWDPVPVPLDPPSGSEEGTWINWTLPPTDEDDSEHEAMRVDVKRFASPIELGIAQATVYKQKQDEDEAEKAKEDEESPAHATTDMYQKAVDRHREAIKWLVITAGSLSVALIGTAPFSGLPDAIRDTGIWGPAAVGFYVTAASLTGILLVVSWLARPVEMTSAELSSPVWRQPSDTRWYWPRWRARLQQQYSADPALFLDGRALDLAAYKRYRACWLGAIADIERLLETEAGETQYKKLLRYLVLAQDRVKEDAASVTANISRGAVAKAGGRAQVAIWTTIAFGLSAVFGFATYLGNTNSPNPPVIDSLKAENIAEGVDVEIQAQATGTGFEYRWLFNGNQVSGDGYEGATSPILIVRDFSAEDQGTYTVHLSDSEGRDSFEEIELTLPPKAP